MITTLRVSRWLPFLLAGAFALGVQWSGPTASHSLPLTPESPSVKEPLPLKLLAAAQALAKGDTEAAYDLARAFVKDQPASAPGQEFLGSVALSRRNLSEADTAFGEALRLEPSRATAVMGQGRVAFARGDAGRAEASFRKAIEMNPRLLEARWNLSMALLRQRRVPQAIAALQESIQFAQGADQTAMYLLAGIAYELGKLGEAERLLVGMGSTDSPGPPVLLAIVKLEQSQPEVAKGLLEQVVARDRQSASARLAGAILDRDGGRPASARAALEKLVADQPQWAIAHFQLGVTLLRMGQKDAALRSFERGENVSTDRDMATVRTAQALLAAGDPDRAVTKARAAMASPSAGGPARAIIVQAGARAGKPEAAEKDLQATVSAMRGDPAPILDLGRYYLARNRPKDALAQFEAAARLDPNAIEPIAGQVQSNLALGQDARAMVVIELAIKAQPGNPNLQIMLASTQEKQGRVAEAEAGYRKALELQPNHLLAMRSLASLYERSKRGADAIRLLEEASQAHPAAAAPLIDLASVQLRAGNTSAGTATLRRALEREPGNPQILNNLAFLLSATPGSLDEALRFAEAAYSGSPGSPSSADTLGWILLLKGDLARSEKLLVQAHAADPKNPQIRYHLGKLLAKQGKKEEARVQLEEALRVGSLPEATDARATLQSLK